MFFYLILLPHRSRIPATVSSPATLPMFTVKCNVLKCIEKIICSMCKNISHAARGKQFIIQGLD